jgi:hypothetical protein
MIAATANSFFAPTAELTRADDVLADYQRSLVRRNGEGFAAREAAMATEFDATQRPSELSLDAARFNRNYVRFGEKDVSKEELALLAFVKINAGEAWGVECVAAAREKQRLVPGVVSEVEKLVTHEEQFHTRLLVGAAGHFHGADGTRLAVTGAWKPSFPLRMIIGALVHAPRSLFHPVLLGAEIAGVYAFNWLLRRLKTLFPESPAVRESMERRLIEVLVDEVGHIAFNRVLVGAPGRAVARVIAQQVTWTHQFQSPELMALGFGKDMVGRMSKFDLLDLPEEVRRRAFFA